jgi:hypothetical protein
MSEENVEIVRRVIDAFQVGFDRGDPAAAFDLDIVADNDKWILTEGSFEGRSVWCGGRAGSNSYAPGMSNSTSCRFRSCA